MNIEQSVKSILTQMPQEAIDFWCAVEGVEPIEKEAFERLFTDYSESGLASLITAIAHVQHMFEEANIAAELTLDLEKAAAAITGKAYAVLSEFDVLTEKPTELKKQEADQERAEAWAGKLWRFLKEHKKLEDWDDLTEFQRHMAANKAVREFASKNKMSFEDREVIGRWLKDQKGEDQEIAEFAAPYVQEHAQILVKHAYEITMEDIMDIIKARQEQDAE